MNWILLSPYKVCMGMGNWIVIKKNRMFIQVPVWYFKNAHGVCAWFVSYVLWYGYGSSNYKGLYDFIAKIF